LSEFVIAVLTLHAEEQCRLSALKRRDRYKRAACSSRHAVVSMLPSFLRSLLPHRFLYPPRRRFRDRPAMKTKSEVSIVRLLSFFFGGILLANFVLMMSAAFRATPAQPSLHVSAAVKRGPAAAVAAERATTPAAATDARAVPEMDEAVSHEPMPNPVTVTIDRGCAEHARERLTAGLTNYYLHRQLRPGAPSEGVADTAGMTSLLAGPGDPATTTPDTSCKG
jgi:hypothetical protein